WPAWARRSDSRPGRRARRRRGREPAAGRRVPAAAGWSRSRRRPGRGQRGPRGRGRGGGRRPFGPTVGPSALGAQSLVLGSVRLAFPSSGSPPPAAARAATMLAVRDRSNTQPPPVWRATGLERQVFLDEAGRRRRLVAVLGIVAALLTAAWLVLLVSG